MWFAKLFGGREDDDSEPSEHPPHPAAGAPKPMAPAVHPHNTEKSLLPKKGQPGKGGFDPYNSGNFDKNKAWERVIR
jgi:hypothetical protein